MGTKKKKKKDFTEDPNEEISGNRIFDEIKDFRIGRLPTGATTLQEVEILPTLVYFHHKELILGKMWCRDPQALFG